MRTAVILAFNPSNAGMYSVDLAAFRVFEGIGMPVDYFVAHSDRGAGLEQYGQIPLQVLPGPERLLHYDNIVYWGDFTTSPQYGLEDFAAQLRRWAGEVDLQEALDRWAATFLLSRQDKGARRLFSVGQNFQTLEKVRERLDLARLAPLYERFDLILPRDSASLAGLAAAFPGLTGGQLAQGLDCAFLLPPPRRPVTAPRETGGGPRIGTFFFRSGFGNLGALYAALSGQGADLVPIERWLTLARADIHAHFCRMRAAVAGCDVVLTDTYHFAINALGEGVVPLVLGHPAAAQTNSLGDYKKKALMADLGAPELYREIAGEALSDKDIAAVRAQAFALAAADAPHPVLAEAARQADSALAAFTSAFLGASLGAFQGAFQGREAPERR